MGVHGIIVVIFRLTIIRFVISVLTTDTGTLFKTAVTPWIHLGICPMSRSLARPGRTGAAKSEPIADAARGCAQSGGRSPGAMAGRLGELLAAAFV